MCFIRGSCIAFMTFKTIDGKEVEGAVERSAQFKVGRVPVMAGPGAVRVGMGMVGGVVAGVVGLVMM